MDYRRIVYNVFVAASLVWFPYWVTLFLAIAGLFIFVNYYEIMIFAFLADSLFAIPLSRFHGYQFIMTLGAIFAYILAEIIRKKMFIYKK